MQLDDDELERALRAIDPARTPATAPLTAAQLAVRDRITSTPPARRRTRPVLWAATALPAAAIIVIALVVVFSFSTVPRAAALTPAALRFTPTSTTAAQVITMTRNLHENIAGPGTPQRASRSIGWYLHVDTIDRATTAAISPEITTFAWEPDQSGRVTIIAGHPYWADGSTDPIPTTAALEPGTVISDMSFEPGTFGAPTIDPPGDDPASMESWLHAMGLPDDADAADIADAIHPAFEYWTFTNTQQQALLQLLLTRPDITVLGSTTDRAGRAVLGVAADSTRTPGIRKIVLISTETGRIVGLETTRTTPADGLPAGSTISYTLWDTPT